MTEIKDMQDVKDKVYTYDEMPYECRSFPQTSPYHLDFIGRVFGLNPEKIEIARILELGCGEGVNLHSFAANNPKAEIIGVDLSKVMIDIGIKKAKEAGLKNIDLKAISITDIDKSYGEFDYIICHGVFSWVPKEVQDKILDIMGNQLKPNGVAFVSYNTLPGWHRANSFRHMLQFHSRYFNTDKEKSDQGRALLNFVSEAVKDSKSPYSEFLENEIKIIQNENDSFLFHEYIAEGNTEFYFSDFVAKASSFGLSYLADASISSMNINNLPQKAAMRLKEINDIVRQEQYMDFITDRRFRNTLLCKKDAKINRNVSSDTIKDMYFSCAILPSTPIDEVNFKSIDNPLEFKCGPRGGVVTSSNNVTSATLYAFQSANGEYISLNDIKSFIKANCKGVEVSKQDEKNILNEILMLLFSGILSAKNSKPHNIYNISHKPQVSDLTLSKIKSGEKYVINQNNESIAIEGFHRIVIGNLDGKHDESDLMKITDDALTKSGQHIELEGKRITDEKLKQKLLGEMVRKSLQLAKGCGLLVG